MPNKKLDELDNKLLLELQRDPRKSNARLAKSLGIAEPTVSRRIEHLVSSGGIIFTALPDMKWFGFQTSAYIGLKINEPAKIPQITEQLCQSPDLRAVSSCEGYADLFVAGDFKSDEALADFITEYLGKIDGISHIDAMVELKHVKQRTFGRIDSRDMKRNITRREDVVVDDIDRRLILELQKDCRAPLKKLARAVDMSEPTVHRRIKHLIASGVIELTATAYSKSTNSIRGFLAIEADMSKLLRVAKSIGRYPEVEFVGIFSGPSQILVGIRASSREQLSDFTTQVLAKTRGVVRISWMIYMKLLKQNFSWLQ